MKEDANNTRKILVDFISKNYLKGRKFNNFLDVSFLDAGIIDSTSVIEIIVFLEDTFKINVEDKEVIPENLDSINKLERYVCNKLTEISI